MAPNARRLRRLVPEPTSPVQAALAVAAATVFILFLAARSGGTGSHAVVSARPASSTPSEIPSEPTAFSASQLRELTATTDQPIYWVGPGSGTVYELSRKGTNLVLRYLPPGVAAGDKQLVTTVGTYSLPNAVVATRAAAASVPDAVRIPIGGGAIAFYRRTRPASVYVAYPGIDYQIEVYSPTPLQARELVTEGALKTVSRAAPG
jgi:hypothetical protein